MLNQNLNDLKKVDIKDLFYKMCFPNDGEKNKVSYLFQITK